MLCQLELGYYLLGLGLEGVYLSYVWWAGSWASTTMVLSAAIGSTIFSEDRVFTPTDTAITPPIEMADKQEK